MGIEPILNPVASKIRQVIKLTSSLVLLGLLAGCAGAGVGMLVNEIVWATSKDAEVECVAADSISVSFRDARPFPYWRPGTNNPPGPQEREAVRMTSSHCDGDYSEVDRVVGSYKIQIYAVCTRTEATSEPEATCWYIAEPDTSGFAEADIGEG